jgi:hypothetical protein
MNYTIQKRINEIVEVLDQIISNIKRDPKRVGLDKPNAVERRKIYQRVSKFSNSEIAWESVVLDKTQKLKDSIENKYKLELEELNEKEAIIKKGLDTWNPQIDGIRKYFFDEHFLMALFYNHPAILGDLGQIIISSEHINWKPTFIKFTEALFSSPENKITTHIKERFGTILSISLTMDREEVLFLFLPKQVNKKDLEQKMESNYERFLIIDKLMNNTTNINQIKESENDMELVLSSLINSDEGYLNLPESLKSSELVYLFAAFNSSHSFQYALDNIRSNEAIVNFTFNNDKFKAHETLNQIKKRALQKQHLKNIYPYASEEIRANAFIADLENSEITGAKGIEGTGGINLGDYSIQ